MPRFFFHVFDDDIAPDEDGMELRDRAAALAEAVRGARSLAAEQGLKGRLNLGHRIVVADEAGDDIATIAYRDAVAVLV